MPDFTFTASAQCDRCGQYLSSSEDDCDNCSAEQLQRFHFRRIGEDEVEIVWAINPIRAWAALHDSVENVIPYRLYESQATSADFHQIGYDVTDEEELRTPNRNF